MAVQAVCQDFCSIDLSLYPAIIVCPILIKLKKTFLRILIYFREILVDSNASSALAVGNTIYWEGKKIIAQKSYCKKQYLQICTMIFKHFTISYVQEDLDFKVHGLQTRCGLLEGEKFWPISPASELLGVQASIYSYRKIEMSEWDTLLLKNSRFRIYISRVYLQVLPLDIGCTTHMNQIIIMDLLIDVQH